MAKQLANPPSVFLSIGRPLSKAQEDFKLALISAVKARGFVPRTVGSGPEDSDVPHVRPIDQIHKLIGECDGAIVVAYEKHLADRLHTNSPAPHPGEMTDVRLTTSWNQAEAAMAYHAGLPMLLVSEEGVYGECLLEDGVIGSVARIEVAASAVWNDVFQRRMTSWAKDVIDFKGAAKSARYRNTDADDLTIGDVFGILGSLNWKSALILSGVLAGLLSAAYGIGFSAHIWLK
jgi:hypothetical protein